MWCVMCVCGGLHENHLSKLLSGSTEVCLWVMSVSLSLLGWKEQLCISWVILIANTFLSCGHTINYVSWFLSFKLQEPEPRAEIVFKLSFTFSDQANSCVLVKGKVRRSIFNFFSILFFQQFLKKKLCPTVLCIIDMAEIISII